MYRSAINRKSRSTTASRNGCNAELHFESYTLGKPMFDEEECLLRGLSYAAPLRVKMRLVVFDKETSTPEKNVIKDIKEQDVYMGEIPLMTDNGTFASGVVEPFVAPSRVLRRLRDSGLALVLELGNIGYARREDEDDPRDDLLLCPGDIVRRCRCEHDRLIRSVTGCG